MTAIYITGTSGQLGGELKVLYPDGIFLSRNEVDLNDEESIHRYFKNKRASLIINCAAYTQVDKAESERDKAVNINAISPAILSRYSEKFIHISTDYVFDGRGFKPYTELSDTAPSNVYGETKLKGEESILKINPKAVIIRTSWLYSHIGNNFLKTIIRLGNERTEIRVVSDQIGTPTCAGNLSKVIVENALINWKFKGGIYHYSNEGVASWYDFAKEIIDLKDMQCKVVPIKSEEYPTPAKRPYYSVLDKTKIKKELMIEIPHWKESLRECLQKIY